MTLKGFSLIELMLAGAVFAVFATGIIGVLLNGFEVDRLGEETTIATAYATEGLEAVRSIKAKSFDDLTMTGATGLAREHDDWVLTGNENTSGKYTRTIAITEVNRDWDGTIDERSGFDVDPDTKRVTVTVSWNVVPSRTDSVVLNTFFTRWK